MAALHSPLYKRLTFDPITWVEGLMLININRHKWDGQPVLVTKSGQNRSSHAGDISQ